MKIKTVDLVGAALDWAVACIEYPDDADLRDPDSGVMGDHESYSTDWAHGGPVIDRAKVTIIRADDDYEVDAQGFTTNKRIPQWFAECSRWTGHSLSTSYEGEHMDPTFMIGEADGYYGPTPLIAAMRCYVASKLGAEVDVPEGIA